MHPAIRRLLDRLKTHQKNREKRPPIYRRYPVLTVSVVAVLLIAGGLFAWQYVKFARMIGERLAGGSLRTSSAIYAAPKLLAPGDAIAPDDLVGRLQRAGYTEKADNRIGYYRRTADGLEITSGPESYFQPHTITVHFKGNQV